MSIVQVCHGELHTLSTGYALSVFNLIPTIGVDRKILAYGGLILKNKIYKIDDVTIKEFRDSKVILRSMLSRKRIMEILISKKTNNKFNKEIANNKDSLFILEGPWHYYTLKKNGVKNIIYHAHNVEYLLRSNDPFQEYVKELERQVVTEAIHIFAITEEDKESFIRIYNIDEKKISLSPTTFKEPKKKWVLNTNKEIIFLASIYKANIDSAGFIIELARKMPEYKFHIIGSVCYKLKSLHPPPNVNLHYVVSEEKKEELYLRSSIALNPMFSGAGMSTKLMEYISYGIPVISTEFGRRGWFKDLNIVIAETLDEYQTKIRELSNNPELLETISKAEIDFSKKFSIEENQANNLSVLYRYL